MPLRSHRAFRMAFLGLVLAGWASPLSADEPDSRTPPLNSLSPRRPTARPGRRDLEASSSTAGFWISSAGVALALAAFGGLSLLARKYRPAGEAGELRVVGRANLSAKHSVYLVKVGDRVLILGAGSSGPPSLLGEVSEPGKPETTGARS